MNIIKLKDIMMPDDLIKSSFYNNYLKGKYAYWVQMRYIVPMGLSFNETTKEMVGMKHEGYVACESNIKKLLRKEDGTLPTPFGSECFDIFEEEEIIPFIDQIETDIINSTSNFRLKNQFTTDSDITIEEVKKFRTWLASTLLSLDQTEKGEQRNQLFDDIQTHVLSYYSNSMYDKTIQILSGFKPVPNLTVETSACGCTHSNNLSSLYNENIHICDSVSEYRKNLYNVMVSMFSEIDFWNNEQMPKEFILEIKKYIDNIIKLNLPLKSSSSIEKYTDCGCVSNSNEQDQYIYILKRLSMSFGYIYNSDVIGHKNYISDALRDWATGLYEYMEW